MRHCLSLSKWSVWTNHRNHALKAEMLLSLSGCGRGFGSVFHHHNVKSQPLSGWDFFCLFPLCWRGVAPRPLEHAPPEVAVPGALSAVFLSLFSAALLSIQGSKSCVGAGLRAIGLLLRLLGSARPRQRKAQKNRLAAACRCGVNVSASLPPVPHVAPARTPTTCRAATG